MAAKILVVIWGDTHTNSTVGLIPPTVRYDDGAERKASDEQQWLWEQNQDLVKFIKKKKRKEQCKCVVVFNGDGPDRNRYSGGYDLITMSRAEIVRWTVEALRPMRDVADAWIQNRGTPAHEGGSGELAELVAKELDATKQPGRDTYSWWFQKYVFGGVYFWISHRPKSVSYFEHTRNNGARRTAHNLWDAFKRMDDDVPNVAVFSHVHHPEEAKHNRMLCVFTHPWKLCDAWGHSVGFGPMVQPVGAWRFLCSKGRYEYDEWYRQPPNEPYIKLDI